MSHCTNPTRCSVCLGVVAQVVTIANGQTLVDGRPAAESLERRRSRERSLRGARATSLRTGVQRRGPR